MENLCSIYRFIYLFHLHLHFYKSKIKTNAGKQSLSYMAIDIWKDLPSSLKDLSVLVFFYIIRYLLSEQKLNQFFT